MLPEDEAEAKQDFVFGPQHQQIAVWAAFFVGLFVLAVGAGLYYFKSDAQSEDIKIISQAGAASSVPSGQIMVDVGGAVNLPGLYKLAPDSRVADAISAAGGLSAEADGTKVNLAAKINDGQKIYIQKTGETLQNGSAGQVAGETEGGLIDINTASQSQLDTLPGVGPVTAGKIISSRPYSSLEELVSKKVVSSSEFEKIKDKISY